MDEVPLYVTGMDTRKGSRAWSGIEGLYLNVDALVDPLDHLGDQVERQEACVHR